MRPELYRRVKHRPSPDDYHPNSGQEIGFSISCVVALEVRVRGWKAKEADGEPAFGSVEAVLWLAY